MFEEFSNSYYIGRLVVTPADTDRPRMQQAQVERLNDEFVTADDGEIVELDRPLVMKLGQRHFPVHGDRRIPADTLSLPEALIEETDIQNPPTVCGVLLAKGPRADQLLWLSGHTGVDVGT